MRKALAGLVGLALAIAAVGCGGAKPYSESRQVLGTAVSVTVYPGDETAKPAVVSAFERVAAVEKTLSPYDASSPIAAINLDPYTPHRLPLEATLVFTTMDAWRVGPTDNPTSVLVPRSGFFSPTLWGVTQLYSFSASETVPRPVDLELAVERAMLWGRAGDEFAFFKRPFAQRHGGGPRRPGLSASVPSTSTAVAASTPLPGLDFGGAAKGLALDFALQQLGGRDAGLITAGSSTIAFGAKPDGEPWRVGIEDPRETGRVIAVVTAGRRPDATGTLPPVPSLSVSTSGDYQLFFERGGIRYHHLLDPATGMPVRGLRSLTVFGRMNGLDADILSTALFVMGRDRALDFARERRIGVYLVDAGGKAAFYVPPSLPGVTLETQADPRP
jgi:thiamine biosynthesis lipoprotein ApbE